MHTHLQDPENNKIVYLDKDTIEKIKLSLVFRIKKHREFIEKDRENIKNNTDTIDLIRHFLSRIVERHSKIEELKEFAKHSLNIDINEF